MSSEELEALEDSLEKWSEKNARKEFRRRMENKFYRKTHLYDQ